MSRSPSLAELQGWMRWALTHPLGVGRAAGGEQLPGLPRRFDPPAVSVLDAVIADAVPGRGALDRLSVYGSGYFSRLHGTLRLEYPRLEAALGDATFRALAAAHLLRRPSTSPSLADLGDELATTLRGSGLAPDAPWTVDLARLERAAAEVWLSEATALTPLAPPPDGDWARARMVLSPAMRVLDLGWDVADWTPGQGPPCRGEHVRVVWRSEATTAVERLDGAAALLIRALARGTTLAEACAEAGEAGLPAEELTALFSAWAGWGWFAGTVSSDGPGA